MVGAEAEPSGLSNAGGGLERTTAHPAAQGPAGVVGAGGRLARPPWRGPAAARRGAASLSREIVRCAQETLHAWAGDQGTRVRRNAEAPPVAVPAPAAARSSAAATAQAVVHTTRATRALTLAPMG